MRKYYIEVRIRDIDSSIIICTAVVIVGILKYTTMIFVSFHARKEFESHSAILTSVRSFAGVINHMSGQILPSRESLAAFLALERGFAGVSPLV